MKKTTALFVFAFLCLACVEENTKSESLQDEINSLQAKNDSLTKLLQDAEIESIDKIEAEILKENQDLQVDNYWFSQYDGDDFKKMGIENPREYIKNELRKKTELIPLKAVVGGTMRFGNIQLLSNKWLIADYNDGHIEGRAIYEYSIAKNKTVSFKIIDQLNH
ncbi:hypothetical protein [Mesonia sp. K7]|uniref:hypothetical protein n=1 Tax=Mesonia sp. K7 TaxID=2218606 RepID=UPI000DA8E1A0|nr:hypothetical protein [Mesonia sp. K7]PZD77008.1 hypothetical protein DNG35_10220 [Mesonia sp. K7]